MRKILSITAAAPLCILMACSGPDTQVLLAPSAPSLRVSPLVSSIEVRDVSLPRYAASDALVKQGENGVLEELPKTVWADTPERSLTLALARDLSVITGARVAVEPWPFAQQPAASVTVRVEQLLARQDNILVLSGQYAIAPVDSGLSDRSGRFDLSVPILGDTPAALANAQSQAMAQLSETIAKRLAR